MQILTRAGLKATSAEPNSVLWKCSTVAIEVNHNTCHAMDDNSAKNGSAQFIFDRAYRADLRINYAPRSNFYQIDMKEYMGNLAKFAVSFYTAFSCRQARWIVEGAYLKPAPR